MKTKLINLYSGPGTGKSTTAARLFSELKHHGINCEYVPEYAKDITWEGRAKIFRCQEYIFGKQSFRNFKLRGEVDVIITDSPLLLSIIYTKLAPVEDQLLSLPLVIREAYDKYDNLDIFLTRNKPYNPKGRNQTKQEAIQLDNDIKTMLIEQNIAFKTIDYSPDMTEILKLMHEHWPN